ncbi:MAG TPA: penicillin-binding transpeptidase domain-containing protein [Xanthomonadaceae bacterium]|nr:penicillin-binding transpeptidase domain-containing protein [Xanthomonadaceae bacterium]
MTARVRSANFRARLLIVVTLLTLVATALVVRAVDLQLLHNEFYQDQGDQRFLREIPIPTSRGAITDRNGEPLAVSTPVESLWANPQELLQHADRIGELARALDVPAEPLMQKIAQRANREFIYLRRHMNPERAQAVLELKIPGVFSQREFRRFYPAGEITAHVLGFTDIDERGMEGLEAAFDTWLSGEPGAKRVIRDRLGRVVENVDLVRPAVPGNDLVLSIDRRIQYLAYRALKSALHEHGASSGSVVVLDVRNGEILAMVNQPSYNPNAREFDDPGARRNRAVTDLFEPGSVIKPFTVAAAIESGRFHPGSVIETSPGTLPLAGHVIRDVHDYGRVDLTRLLTKSSNVAATKLSMELPDEHFYDVLQRFGFGRATGAGFIGENAGVLPQPRWGTLQKATISYGYGLSVTALQLAQAYAALGNGGRLHPPSFVRGAHDPPRTVIDPELAGTLLGMLETVTGTDGTAQRAVVRGYRVAGKTGTSRKAGVGGYDRRYISLFAGLVPASRPRFATVVMINDPQGRDYYGGLVAAPVYAQVMDGALRLLDVPLDDARGWLVDAPERPLPAPGMPPLEAELVPESIAGASPR